MKFHSAYLKLTAFYVLIIMIISVGFSMVLYGISSKEIGRGLGNQAKVFKDLQIIGGPLTRPSQDFEQIRREQLTESAGRLRLNLIYFNLLILLLSSVSSYFLARRTLRPIEDAMDAQNRFTADASHELRTPLTAMRSEIEVALRGKMSLDGAKKLLNSNLEEVEKLEALSTALFNQARYDEESRLSFGDISTQEVVVEAYERIEKMAAIKSVVFENEMIDLAIRGDHQSLVELFVILLDNAIKYSHKNGRISISIHRSGRFAEIRIKDNGLGIKASDLPYIFNRFYRADSSRAREKIPGYGLGLSIAKNIVDLHHGSITAESHGHGSQFLVRLPLISDLPK